MKRFAILFNKELVTRFLQSNRREYYHTICTTYQTDISDELRDSLRELLPTKPDLEELEKCMNQYCQKEVIIHVCYLNSKELRVLILKAPDLKF